LLSHWQGSLGAKGTEEAGKELQCIKTVLLASMQGYNPSTAIEFGRKVLYSTERPTFGELEAHVKKNKTAGRIEHGPMAKKLQPIIIKRVQEGRPRRAWWCLEDRLRRLCDGHDGLFLADVAAGQHHGGRQKRHLRLFSIATQSSHCKAAQVQAASNSIIHRRWQRFDPKSAGQSKRGEGTDSKHQKEPHRRSSAKLKRANFVMPKRLAERQPRKSPAVISSEPEAMAEFSSQIKLEITPDGLLQIQIVDDQRRPMFDSGSAAVKALHA
jgi:hypothetical protein